MGKRLKVFWLHQKMAFAGIYRCRDYADRNALTEENKSGQFKLVKTHKVGEPVRVRKLSS
jgi:hypothetical protein